MSAIEDALKVLETPEAEGGLSDYEKILAASNILRAVVAAPAAEPPVAPVEPAAPATDASQTPAQ